MTSIIKDDILTEQNSCVSSNNKYLDALYNKFKDEFSSYLSNHKNTVQLLVENSTLKRIKASEYLKNQEKNKSQLTPIPHISRKKIKSEQEKEELDKLERNAVCMRKIEYCYKIKMEQLMKKYGDKMKDIISIQRNVRDYLKKRANEKETINDDNIDDIYKKINPVINEKNPKKYSFKKKKNKNNNIIHNDNINNYTNNFYKRNSKDLIDGNNRNSRSTLKLKKNDKKNENEDKILLNNKSNGHFKPSSLKSFNSKSMKSFNPNLNKTNNLSLKKQNNQNSIKVVNSNTKINGNQNSNSIIPINDSLDNNNYNSTNKKKKKKKKK